MIGTDQWQQWARSKSSSMMKSTNLDDDLLGSEEVDQHVLRHMQLPESRASLEDDSHDEDDICMQMKMLGGMPPCPPIPTGSLAPPTLRRAHNGTADMFPPPPQSLERGVTPASYPQHDLIRLDPSRTDAAVSA
jgi:hypothetical protein